MWRWHAAVASEVAAVGSSGVRQSQRRRCAVAAACGSSPGRCQRYVPHKFAERGGGVLQICFVYDRHTYNMSYHGVRKSYTEGKI